MPKIIMKTVLAFACQLSFALAFAATEFELVMVEQAGCIYCERWDKEVSKEYPESKEGLAAPLRRIDLNEPVPEDLQFESKPRITPTFVLVKEGIEQSRLEGYPGEDFFWGLLGKMLNEAGVELQESAPSN